MGRGLQHRFANVFKAGGMRIFSSGTKNSIDIIKRVEYFGFMLIPSTGQAMNCHILHE